MAWFTGKVTLGNFADIVGAVNKFSGSEKNFEKNFDTALGFEDKAGGTTSTHEDKAGGTTSTHEDKAGGTTSTHDFRSNMLEKPQICMKFGINLRGVHMICLNTKVILGCGTVSVAGLMETSAISTHIQVVELKKKHSCRQLSMNSRLPFVYMKCVVNMSVKKKRCLS